MGKFIIQGKRTLRGGVRVSGSKNAALPIIFASLVTNGVSRFYNLPNIGDVRDALSIISELGAKVTHSAGVTLVDTRSLSYVTPDSSKVKRIRASTYLIGSCLARFGRAELLEFGGCSFAARPIDMHLDAAKSFGATIKENTLSAPMITAAQIIFRRKSVGATVNSLILASCAKGESKLYGCAKEPHIMTLISYLTSAGAKISIKGDVITVDGGELKGGTAVIPGDMIEAGSFLAASIVTDGRIRVTGFDPRELASFTSPLLSAGVIENVSGDGIMLVGRPKKEISVCTGAYPDFPTDLQPIFSTILATALGGHIEDTVWRTRFGYLDELARFGLSYSRSDNRVRIYTSEILPAKVRSRDLRGGAAAIILGLFADGESIIEDGELVLRGYDSFVEKLRDLGADIVYEENT